MQPIVIIYGATGAIGSATAKLLDERKYPLHLVGRNQEKLTEMGHDLNADITIGDVSETDLFKRVSTDIKGAVGGLVYAVGTLNLGSIRRFKEADFLLDFKVNAMGAALAIQSALPKFKKNIEMSSVVFFSSVAAQKGFSMHASLGMAKGAVEGLTKSLAAELAPNIRVNAIAPSVTQTPLADKILSNKDMASVIRKQHALKRLGTRDDMAQLAAFLISKEAAWITGQIIGVDGGRSTLESPV